MHARFWKATPPTNNFVENQHFEHSWTHISTHSRKRSTVDHKIGAHPSTTVHISDNWQTKIIIFNQIYDSSFIIYVEGTAASGNFHFPQYSVKTKLFLMNYESYTHVDYLWIYYIYTFNLCWGSWLVFKSLIGISHRRNSFCYFLIKNILKKVIKNFPS